jgi:hypothetical protein
VLAVARRQIERSFARSEVQVELEATQGACTGVLEVGGPGKVAVHARQLLQELSKRL